MNQLPRWQPKIDCYLSIRFHSSKVFDYVTRQKVNKRMSLVTDLAAAITRQENVNPSYNNPGAIFDVPNNRVKQYGTYQEGYQALLNTINAKIGRGYNLYQFFAEYAPLGHGANDPKQYAENVAGWLGIDPNVPLMNIDGTSAANPSTGAIVANPSPSGDPVVVDPATGLPSFSIDVTAMGDRLPYVVGALIGGLLYLFATES